MSGRMLETVVLGLNEVGRTFLKAAARSEWFDIQAVADKDGGLAEKLSGEYECAAYDDYRQLITAMDGRLAEGQARCLLAAAGMHTCEEYVRMAMKKRFNILSAAPGGRDFDEAGELVRLADEEGVMFAVANPKRYAASFATLHEHIEQGLVEDVFLIAGFCSFAGEESPRWQSDPKLAGGGVLMHKAFGMVDQIMWNFPIPQQVYSLNTNQAADKQQRLSLTEDTAVLLMKFSDRLVGNLIVSSRSSVWPRQEFVKVCGRDRILVVNDVRLTVRDGEGQIEDEFKYEYDPVDCMVGVLDDFGTSVLGSGENELSSSGLENLKSMAVIESAYLSARTGMPEEPGGILRIGQFEPREIGEDF